MNSIPAQVAVRSIFFWQIEAERTELLRKSVPTAEKLMISIIPNVRSANITIITEKSPTDQKSVGVVSIQTPFQSPCHSKVANIANEPYA